MQADYKGYLVMFGNTQLPNSFLTRYRSTPDQRIEKKAWRDNNESLQRVTSPNFKTTLNLELRPLSQREKDLFNSIKANGLQDATQKKYRVIYEMLLMSLENSMHYTNRTHLHQNAASCHRLLSFWYSCLPAWV